MAELKDIRIAVSGIYQYAREELPSLQLPMPEASGAEEKRVYNVYRPATVLAAACGLFKMLPLTHHHPRVPVDGQNFKELVIGYTGENPRVDFLEGKDEVGIRSTMMLYDDEAVEAYENGEIQLSPGYNADFEWRKGTAPDGTPYDIVMKKIRSVNHLALLPAGRGGPDAVVLDGEPTIFDLVRLSKDAEKVVQVTNSNGTTFERHIQTSEKPEEEKKPKDKRNYDFLTDEHGNIDFGKITEEQAKAIGTQTGGGIRLTSGDEWYGKEHLSGKHLEQIKQAGYNSVEEFVSDIAKNFDEIRTGDSSARVNFTLVKHTTRGVLYIELEKDSEETPFYTVNSGGKFSQKYIDKKKLLWSAHHAGSANPVSSDCGVLTCTAQDSPTAMRASIPDHNNTQIIPQDSDNVKFFERKKIAGTIYEKGSGDNGEPKGTPHHGTAPDKLVADVNSITWDQDVVKQAEKGKSIFDICAERRRTVFDLYK